MPVKSEQSERAGGWALVLLSGSEPESLRIATLLYHIHLKNELTGVHPSSDMPG